MKPNACYLCPDHGVDPLCHSYCERYKEQQAWQDKVNAQRRLERSKYPIKESCSFMYYTRNKASIGELK